MPQPVGQPSSSMKLNRGGKPGFNLRRRLKRMVHAFRDKDLDQRSGSGSTHNSETHKPLIQTSNTCETDQINEQPVTTEPVKDQVTNNVRDETDTSDANEPVLHTHEGDAEANSSMEDLSDKEDEGRREIYVQVPGEDGYQHTASLHGLVDSGASCNIILKSIYDGLNQGDYFRCQTPVTVKGTDGPGITAIGYQNLFFTFGKAKEYQAKFYIIRDPEEGGRPHWDVLLGRVFLRQYKLLAYSTKMGEAYYANIEKLVSQAPKQDVEVQFDGNDSNGYLATLSH